MTIHQSIPPTLNLMAEVVWPQLVETTMSESVAFQGPINVKPRAALLTVYSYGNWSQMARTESSHISRL